MKNAIRYFYNLDVDSIRYSSDKYILEVNNNIYCFRKVYDDSIRDKYKIVSSNPLLFKIIINSFNDIITRIQNDNYILLYIDKSKRNIDISDLYQFSNMIVYSAVNPVTRAINLWSGRVDYIEYQLSENGKKYPLIKKSFGYYSGLTENSIQLLREVEAEKISLYMMHNRINYYDSTNELYDPLNIVIDSKVRDISEYLKSKAINGIEVYDDFINYLKYLNINEIVFFFARFMYPSYYYDLYEKIIVDNLNDNIIDNIINNCSFYEDEMKKIYQYLRHNYNLFNIDWLNE